MNNATAVQSGAVISDVHRQGFVRTYIFSLDHKVIGIQYAVTGLLFLLFGFVLMMIMRYQLAYPMTPVPIIGGLLSQASAANGVLLPEFYNELGAMHGTVMIFRPGEGHELFQDGE